MFLRCVAQLDFIDGPLPAGTIVRRLDPTELEVKGGQFFGGLRDDEKRQHDQTGETRWVVIDWKEKRRRVPLRAFVEAKRQQTLLGDAA